MTLSTDGSPTDAPPPATHLSRTAVLAAMFAVPVCCPPMSLLACIAGAVAIRQIRRDARVHGTWLAVAAIVVGAASAGVMSTLLWNNGLALLWRGPAAPLQALMRADTSDMPTHWTGPAAAQSASELQSFAARLTDAHGAYRGAQESRTRATPLKPPAGKSVAPVPVTLLFERDSVEADLGLQLFDPLTGATVMKWRSLRVMDPTLGDLVFPTGEPAPPQLEPPSSPTAPSRTPATSSTGETPARPAPSAPLR